MMMNNLYQHQKEFLVLNPNKSSLVWSCGCGKTRAAIEWIKKHNIGQVLIICPKALKANWRREVEKWMSFYPHIAIFSKEEFRKNWQILPQAETVICDEVHNGFLTPNFKSQMSKALKKYLAKHNVPRVLLLSATVYTSSPWNIYNLAYYTGHIWNYQSFKYEFFDDIRMGMRWIPVAKKGIEPRLAELTRSIASVVNIADVLDVPLQHHTDPEYFALSKTQQKAIKDNYDPLPIVRYTAQHSIENGILNANEFKKAQVFSSDKSERILQLCEENKKVAVVCRYNMQLDSLHLMLQTKLKDKLVYSIRGDVKDRDALTLAAENSDSCVVLIQADCSMGYQLPSFELCIFASMSFSFSNKQQMEGRFLRIDKPSRTTFMYLLTEGDSIDQAVFDAVARKQDFQMNLYEKK